MPQNIQGELCIGGDSIARGYLNNPELTDDKFVPNPFESRKKMYRTGDYGRWTATGEIEFLGRIDHQVKIRGYRVELGEIENQLMKHISIQDAVVIDREDTTGKKYLCVYFVSEIDIEIPELKTLLSQKLPDYMIPSVFMKLNEIPLTHNGKVDRKALLESEILLNSTKEFVGPRNDIDEKLIVIWSEILNIKDIGIDDSFFDIGGDSLAIIEAQIEMLKYGWNLNTQEFYEFNTIKKLSDRILGIADEINDIYFGEIAVTSLEENIPDTSYIVNNSATLKMYKQGFKYSNVLLTGATGFLGIHILKDLLCETCTTIYCLIRGNSDNDAKQRLIGLLESYFPNDYINIDYSRIFVIRGDISSSKFGVEKQVYENLGKNIDLLIHTAAIVKYFGDYEEFNKVNVMGTEVCSKFCMKFNTPLAYMSTLGVSGNYLVAQEHHEAIFTEDDFYIGQKYMDNVYTRSKFEAEKLLYQNVEHGLIVNIFRLGNLTGRYSDGHFQLNAHENAFCNTLRSLIGLGAVNREVLERKAEFTPVDHCSKAIITLLNVEKLSSRVYHIFNHNLISFNIMLELFSTSGINIEIVDNDDFSQYIDEIASDSKRKKLLVGIINDLDTNNFLDFGSFVNINSMITIDNLKQLGFEWTKVDDVYLSKIIKHMKTKGYIE